MNNAFKNIFLLVTTVVIFLIVSEVLLRLTSIGDYSLNRRALFYSTPSFVLHDDGVVRYARNAAIRSVAIYGDNIDYDVVNMTNNMGLYDNIPYEKTSESIKNVAFLGDSFTAGSGSKKPWVTTLRETYGEEGHQYYNLGIGGTGVEQFGTLLQMFSTHVALDEVNIMVISNDFFRVQWYPLDGPGGLRLCSRAQSTQECMQYTRPVIEEVGIEDSTDSILNRARDIYEQKKVNEDAKKSFKNKVRLFNIGCDLIAHFRKDRASLYDDCPHLKLFRALQYTKNPQYYKSLETIKSLITQYPDVRFRLFHFPEKEEVYAGSYALDVAKDIEELGIEYLPLYNLCDWDLSMFHKHDTHPNDQGYLKLAECVSRFID